MIKTKCLYDKPEPADSQRILITRLWPRGISKAKLQIAQWMKGVAPSSELLADWKQKKISWPEYITRYTEEMADQEDLLEILVAPAQQGTITLLCYERESDPHCHRYLLQELIEDRLQHSSKIHIEPD